MSDILQIGRSGLMAARAALEVTGENIANVNTPGYRRREVTQAENVVRSPAPELRSGTGQGVLVTGVRRAFDALLAGRTREATSAHSAAETAQPYLERLEGRLMPEGGGPGPALDGFFSALGSLAATPTDTGLRNVVIETGKGLATGITDLAASLRDLGRGIADETTQNVDRANQILTGLADVQTLIRREGSGRADAGLLDRRDALLQELSGITAINVRVADNDLVTVRLGRDADGPLLLDGAQAAQIAMQDDGLIGIRPAGGGADTARRTDSGALHGLFMAAGSVSEALNRVGAWAESIATQTAALHATGADLEGRPGEALFSYDANSQVMQFRLSDPSRIAAASLALIEPATGNVGTGHVALAGPVDPAQLTAELVLRVTDGVAPSLTLTDTAGTPIASGQPDASGRITLGPLTLTAGGNLQTGDRFAIGAMPPRSGDGSVIGALADLRSDDGTGQDGFGAAYAGLLADIGAQVAAMRDRVATTAAQRDSAQQAEAAGSAVDLDAEAAKLVQQQQAYQANARVVTVARELFDTLLATL